MTADGKLAANAAVEPLPAATVSLVRDSSRGLEVLMLQRGHSLRFMPGVFVFPGGGLDAADGSAGMAALCRGPTDAEASRKLGIASGGLAYSIAAIREAFEEAGILLAYDRAGKIVDVHDAAGRFDAHRHGLHKRHGDFGSILRTEGLKLATDRLTYFGHWITPVTVPRRYDTRFFMAVAPEGQEARHDGSESIAHRWLLPQEALDARDELGLRFPTIKTLEQFAQCDSTAALARALAGKSVVRPLLPRMTTDGRTLLPGEPGYDEQG